MNLSTLRVPLARREKPKGPLCELQSMWYIWLAVKPRLAATCEDEAVP